MKIKNIIKHTFVLIVTVVALYFILSKPKTTVMITEYDKKYANFYPPTCFISLDKRKFLVKDIYVYKQGILTEHRFAAGESFASVRINLFDRSTYYGMSCSQVTKAFWEKKYIDINSIRYKILTDKGDTLVYKNSANKMLLVIGSKR